MKNTELAHGDDLQREEHPANEGVALPFQREPDAAVQADQPYACNGDDRRGDVEKGGALARDRPPDEGDKHAIDSGEEGAGAWGGVLQPQGLEDVGKGEEHPREHPLPKIGHVEELPLSETDEPEQHRGDKKTKGE